MGTYLAPGVYVEEVAGGTQPIAAVGTSTAGFIGVLADRVEVPRPTKENPDATERFKMPEPGGAQLCTNFAEFVKHFGGFSRDPGLRNLAHGVYGFFNNGGSRCFVSRVAPASGSKPPSGKPKPGDKGKGAPKSSSGREPNLAPALTAFEAVDEIAIVAAPGLVSAASRSAIVDHCKNPNLQDRFAIFDSVEELDDVSSPDAVGAPDNSDYAAFYVPWIQVFDPATGDPQFVPPSGHMAGVYARVDTERGVHKAPANEVVRGALGLKVAISKGIQEGLNPKGVNCIRDMNGNIRVWGARTIGGDDNGEWKYIPIRRLFLMLRESIDEGTQWVVFEPNDAALWAKIKRNVGAFLTNVWRSGALFGATPDQAFYVKCDEELNPKEVRDAGQVVTEIGVAVVTPAEFVIFRISQKSETA